MYHFFVIFGWYLVTFCGETFTISRFYILILQGHHQGVVWGSYRRRRPKKQRA